MTRIRLTSSDGLCDTVLMTTQPRFTVYQLLPHALHEAYWMQHPLTHYTLVATVAATVLSQTFDICNHGVPGRPDNWTSNPEVLELFVPAHRVRSLSVGDVVSDELGDWYRCAPVGWVKLDADWFADPSSTPQRTDMSDRLRFPIVPPL
jgi:hypothetical protein